MSTNRIAGYEESSMIPPSPEFNAGLPTITTAEGLYGCVQNQALFEEQYRRALQLASIRPDPRQKADLN